MKRVTATEARKNWFRLLDEVAAGEVVVIERAGRHLRLQRQDQSEAAGASRIPSYEDALRVPDLDQADRWSWDWSDEAPGLLPTTRSTR